MSDSGVRVNGAIELGADRDIQRPVRHNPMAGKTSYPFATLEVGQHFYVARNASTVRAAVKRFMALHKDSKKRFETWKGSDKRIVVKRVK